MFGLGDYIKYTLDVIDAEKMILSTNDKIFVETPDSSGLIVATISTIGL